MGQQFGRSPSCVRQQCRSARRPLRLPQRVGACLSQRLHSAEDHVSCITLKRVYVTHHVSSAGESNAPPSPWAPHASPPRSWRHSSSIPLILAAAPIRCGLRQKFRQRVSSKVSMIKLANRGRELSPKHRLSKRQLEVARLVTHGLTNKEIASTSFISQRTAEGHVAQICNKLGFSTRAQIAAWAATLDAREALPVSAPKASAAEVVAPAPNRRSLVVSGTAARWIGVAIIAAGLLGAGLLALKLAPQTGAPAALTIADGLSRPNGVAIDAKGAVLVMDGDQVHRISDGKASLVAG